MTEPRQHILESLSGEILKCNENNIQVLVLGDMNESVFSTSLNSILSTCGLHNVTTSVIGTDVSFRTYNLGSKVIDGAWASTAVLNAITTVSYAPFQYILPSDHRPMLIDIDLKKLLDDHTLSLHPPAYRRLKTTVPKRVDIYVNKVREKWITHNISFRLEQLVSLFNTEGATPTNISRLISIDEQMQQFFTYSEHQCAQTSSHGSSLFQLH